MVWERFSCHIFGSLILINYGLNATVYLSIVADHVYDNSPSSNGYFQLDNAPFHKAIVISDWFHEHAARFQHLVESKPKRNYAVFRAKEGSTQYE